jgi:hypothetical protein
VTKKKGSGLAPSIGGILVGFDQQIFRTTPHVNELVAKGARLPSAAAAGGGRLTIDIPEGGQGMERLELSAPDVTVVVDLVAGGRIASLVIDGRELLKTTGADAIAWGSPRRAAANSSGEITAALTTRLLFRCRPSRTSDNSRRGRSVRSRRRRAQPTTPRRR